MSTPVENSAPKAPSILPVAIPLLLIALAAAGWSVYAQLDHWGILKGSEGASNAPASSAQADGSEVGTAANPSTEGSPSSPLLFQYQEKVQGQSRSFQPGLQEFQAILVRMGRMPAFDASGASNVDGYFGEQTQGAVNEFQQSHMLEATGNIDQKTAEALRSNDLTVLVKVGALAGPQDRLNVRDSASVAGTIVEKLNVGAPVGVVGIVAETQGTSQVWYQVKTSGGTVGYCAAQFLEVPQADQSRIPVLPSAAQSSATENPINLTASAFLPMKVTASSIYPNDKVYDFSPIAVLAGDPNKGVWVENAPGDGVGEWIQLSWNGAGTETSVTKIRIAIGFNATSKKGVNLWDTNSRPKTLRVEFSNGKVARLDLADKPELQEFDVSSEGAVTSARFVIEDSVIGAQGDTQDVCIGKIELWGYLPSGV